MGLSGDVKPRKGLGLAVLGSVALACLGVNAPALAKVPYAEGPLLDVVKSMPEGTWKRVNQNSYSAAWTPSALRPLYNGVVISPSKIIGAWSSFTWDSNRGDLVIYGGGHANYSGNDVYRWRSRTLQWERAALPSETKYIGSSTWTAIDGADAAPTSAHTYDNAVFLPNADRVMNFGGAIYNTGGAYTRPSEADPSVLRYTGPYLFDPSKADPNKVGGTTGSHVQRVSPYPEILGGEMWQNRDMFKHFPTSVLPKSHVSGCTGYSNESASADVVYVGARTVAGATALELYRYEITDVSAPWTDVITRIGRYWSSPSAQTTCAYDPVSNIVLRTGTNTSPFFYWDLATAGPKNYEKRVDVTASVKAMLDHLNAAGSEVRKCAMDYDPHRLRYVMWCGTGQVWAVKPPNPITTAGWEVEFLDLPVGEVPPNNVGVGILGKWEYIPGFDVFMGLENSVDGNVWVYKPVGWVHPTASGGDPDAGGGGGNPPPPPPVNEAPQVVLTSPTEGVTTPVGSIVVLSANATDVDGSIARVVFRVDGVAVATASAAPYSVDWVPAAAGSFVVTAEAFDDKEASTLSVAVNVVVEPLVEPPVTGSGSAVIQRSDSGEFKTADTYLSSYHKASNYGASNRMLLWRDKYVPLMRFAVFASEGGPVPDGAVIKAARLSLYKGVYIMTPAVHAMLVPWEEAETTWERPRVGQTWSVPGASGAGVDYDADEDARVTTGWDAGWVVFDVTERVAAMSAGAVPNFGWRTVWVSGGYNTMTVQSSEYVTDVNLRPKLEVEWAMPAD